MGFASGGDTHTQLQRTGNYHLLAVTGSIMMLLGLIRLTPTMLNPISSKTWWSQWKHHSTNQDIYHTPLPRSYSHSTKIDKDSGFQLPHLNRDASVRQRRGREIQSAPPHGAAESSFRFISLDKVPLKTDAGGRSRLCGRMEAKHKDHASPWVLQPSGL